MDTVIDPNASLPVADPNNNGFDGTGANADHGNSNTGGNFNNGVANNGYNGTTSANGYVANPNMVSKYSGTNNWAGALKPNPNLKGNGLNGNGTANYGGTNTPAGSPNGH